MKLFDQIESFITRIISQLFQTVIGLIKKVNLPKILSLLWHHKKRVALLLVIIYAANYAYRYFFPGNQNALPPIVVSTTLVEKKEMPLILEATGNTVAVNIVDIRPQITNVVAKIHIKDGQEVKAGDSLFTLDDRADKANFEKAKALADDATRQYKRAQELFEKKFFSQAALDTSLANMKSAQASAKAAEVALSFNYLRSPIAGRVGVINVYPGTLVQASNIVSSTSTATATVTTGAMVTVTQLDPINIQFTIPEKDLPILLQNKGDDNALTVAVDVAGSDKPVTGKVFVIDNQVDTSIGAVRLKAQIANKDRLMIPGQFVRLRLTAKNIKDALVVPTQAVVNSINGNFVYTVKENNTVDLVPVKVIYQYQGQSVIAGVEDKTKIVVEGKQNLRPGNPIIESKPAEKK